jgi:hypothetical protein
MIQMAAQMGLSIQDNRGHAENSGSHLTARQYVLSKMFSQDICTPYNKKLAPS